jgi:FkbM family methyltransferase
MKKIFNTLRFILSHPLNRDRKLSAAVRWLRWQIGSRIIPGSVAVNYAANSRLLVNRGMTGATGNVYCGLHEFNDMAFLLHFLRPGELFVDIGANVGSYTVLASGVVGAKTLAIEPVPATFVHLTDNINLNGVYDLVRAENIALGSSESSLEMTCDQDTVNHAVTDSDKGVQTVTVQVKRLDDLMCGTVPSLIKIDVEGYETEVIGGAVQVLTNPCCQVVIMELNESGSRYGYDDKDLHHKMLDYGFSPYTYDPQTRVLRFLNDEVSVGDNTIYIKNREAALKRVQCANPVLILGKEV